MKNFLFSYWLWAIVLLSFIVIILWDDKLEQATASYVKHRMVLKNVNFSQVEGGFEHARLFADICDMDDSQSNMNASNVRTIFYKQEQATWTGRLISERALKNPFEAKFWGDVRGWNTDDERIRTDELRYYFNRKELHTQKPVTIWKGDAVLTGLGLRYNTQDKEAQINQQVVIRIWETASKTAKAGGDEHAQISELPVAPPLSQLLLPLNTRATGTASLPVSIASDSTPAIATFITDPNKELQP
ncbi:MAG: LPS export ABC transporter periplasmic protein LptC [Candidatus Riflebacteria bacterium HGW-Riflebacteria-1]|jgi:LPS export ABC transporter protein LptC|nr:MAG: LPS export ABC transporter periplasmic protein LptC [Candidatus Riflebacteria bacterium HGW-Riflebacteria-1]